MAQERLNRLAALSVHRNMNISENEIIEKFARMHPRRMQMIDILHSDDRLTQLRMLVHEFVKNNRFLVISEFFLVL